MNNLTFIAYGYSMDAEVDAMLKSAGVDGYTKWTEVSGEGYCEPHLGTDVWPLRNNFIMVACDEPLKEKLKKGALTLREKFPEAGIRMFVTPLSEVV